MIEISYIQIRGIVLRFIRQIIRSKWTIPYLFLFPMFFILMFWVGFSQSAIGTAQTYEIGLINDDNGFSDAMEEIFSNETYIYLIFGDFEEMDMDLNFSKVLEDGFSAELLQIIQGIQYEDTEQDMFKITEYTSKDAYHSDLETRKLDAGMEIGQTFTNAVISFLGDYYHLINNRSLIEDLRQFDPSLPDLPVVEQVAIIIRGDENYINFQQAESILSIILEEYMDINNLFAEGTHMDLRLDYGIFETPDYTVFDLLSPGLIMFGIIVQPSLYAAFLGEEFRPTRKRFDRVLTAPVKARTYLFASLVVQIPMILVQAGILFLFSFILGFNPQGNIALGFLVSITLIPFTAALNYIAAAFLYDEDTIGFLYGFGAPLLGYASGAFSALPQIVLFKNIMPTSTGMTRDFLIWDLLPTTHTINAMRSVLLWDFSLTDVGYDIIVNLAISVVFLVLSMWIFAHTRFGGDK